MSRYFIAPRLNLAVRPLFMSTAVKTCLWLLLAVISGAAGYYFGFSPGAETLGIIEVQNSVSGTLSKIKASLVALEKKA